MKRLTHRERVLTALDHSEPDRVPFCLGGTVCTMTDNAYKGMAEYLKLPGNMVVDKIWRTVQRFDEEFLEYLDIDYRYIFIKSPKSFKLKPSKDKVWYDEWGIGRRGTKDYNEMVVHPLENATIDDLESYKWPNPYDLSRVEGLEKEARGLYNKTDYAIVAANAGITFELCMYLMGIENFLVTMLINKGLALKLVEKVTEFNLGVYEIFMDTVGKFVQVVDMADDLGTQLSTYISPELYREMIKPSHKKLIELIKSKTNAKVFMHSCGAIYDIIPDLIDIGVDILNPIQPLAKGMDSKRLKKSFGDKLCFQGGVDVQKVLPEGTIDDVEAEVKRNIRNLAKGGGYILAASHDIQVDVPPKNLLAMFEMAKKYGTY